MTYDVAIEQRDISKIDKLNKLKNLETFWTDACKLTRAVKSDRAIHRWQCLAEIRFNELKCEKLNDFNYFRNSLRSEIGSSTMDLVDDYIKGMGRLPTYDLSSSNIDDANYLRRLYITLNNLGLM